MPALGVGSRRVTAFAPAILVAYLAWLVASPLGHHDLRCHLKSATHCTTCVQTSVGSLDAARIPPCAGLVERDAVPVERSGSPAPTPVAEPGDRSPPIS